MLVTSLTYRTHGNVMQGNIHVLNGVVPGTLIPDWIHRTNCGMFMCSVELYLNADFIPQHMEREDDATELGFGFQKHLHCIS